MNAMATLQISWIFVIIAVQHVHADFRVDNQDLTIIAGSRGSFNLSLTQKLKTRVHVAFDVEHKDLLRTEPAAFNITENDNNTVWNITVLALSPGSVTISLNVTPEDAVKYSDAFVRVKIERSDILYHISHAVGWIYFLAWSVSFYPQIYSNYQRQSVVGLNFDFLSLNIVGFIMYAFFNCGLYWIPEVEDEYFRRYPKGLNPVQVNDIFFALHAVLATAFTIAQCFIYEIGSQRVSITVRGIHGIFTSFILISALLSIIQVITWLDFLYFCSYVKLAITLIKYVPQAYYNYQRKSTVGWSIGNIFLDFTGGILSMLQMILNAYNYDDWESLFGDPTKFGLGFFSVAFDIFFLVQHYVLYRNRLEYTELPGTCQAEPESQDTTKATNSNA